MKALAIDCAVSKIAIAVKNESNMVKMVLDIGTKQSEKLLPTIDFLMKEANLESKDLDYTTVTLGPGTFTGLRLGLSSLKALNLANGTPVYGIPSLEAYAWPYKKSIEVVLPVIEAKEDEYFYAFYARGIQVAKDDDKSLDDILKEINEDSCVTVCGPGAKKFVQREKEISSLYSVHEFSPENDACESLFEIAEKMIEEKKEPMQDYDGPLYVRKSEAEIVLENKQKNQQN